MPVKMFDRGDPNRNRSQAKWFEQLKIEHMRLKPGNPDVELSRDKKQREKDRLMAGVHEVKLPERGIAQLCRNCRKATRESTWIVRCGSCGDLFSPVLWLATACEHCGGDEGALQQLAEHLLRIHSPDGFSGLL